MPQVVQLQILERHTVKKGQVQCLFNVSLLFLLAGALVINIQQSRTVTPPQSH